MLYHVVRLSFLLNHVVRLFPYLLHCSFVVNIFGLNVQNQGSVTLLQTNSAERKSLLYPLICFRVDWDLGVLEFIVVFQSGKCQLKFRRRKKKDLISVDLIFALRRYFAKNKCIIH